jgi:hypothetical protein
MRAKLVAAASIVAALLCTAAAAQTVPNPLAPPVGRRATPPATTAPAPAPPAATSSRQPSAGQLAVRERMKRCGAEWRQAKAAGGVPAGQKWPQYWSACNTRLKGANG